MAITIDELQIEIQAKGAESASGIDALTKSLGALKSMINKSLVGKLESLSSALDGIKAPITVNMNVKGMEQLKKSVQEATANMPAYAANISPTVDGSAVASEMNRIKASTEQASSSFETISSEAKRAKQELKSAGDAAGDAGKKLKEVGTSAKQGASGLSEFVSSLKRILMYRVVRSILSNIARAAKEGTQNLVQYSKAIGGIDASRANATMSQFASIGMQVKNTIGSAVMPVLNALMPVIQTLANWFIIAANAVNQFFAAISGASMWTKAKEYAVDYAGGLGEAAGAASDLKNAMLGIDELNVISPNSGGGGGGAPDYGDMFEEVPIDSFIADLVLAVKDIFFKWDDLTLNDIINKIIVGLGALTGAIIGWKLGGPAGAIIGTIAGVALGLLITQLIPDFSNLSGRDIQTLIVAGIGAVIGGIAGFMLGGIPGAAVGIFVGTGIGLVIDKLIPDFSNLSKGEIQSLITSGISGAIGFAVGFGLGGFAGGVLGLVIGVGLSIIVNEYRDDIKKWWKEKVAPWFTKERWQKLGDDAGQGLKTKWNEFKDWWSNTAIVKWWNEHVAPWFTLARWQTLADNIRQGIVNKWDELVRWWNTLGIVRWWNEDVKPWFTLARWLELAASIKDSIKTAWAGMVNKWKTDISDWWENDVKKWFKFETWQQLGKDALDGLLGGLGDLWEKGKELGSELIGGFRSRDGLDSHSPSLAFKEAGLDAVAGFDVGFGDLSTVVDVTRKALSSILGETDKFSSNVTGKLAALFDAISSGLATSKSKMNSFTADTAKMFETMAARSNTAIQSIISNLDAIPRNIRTVHTVVTQSVSGGSSSSGVNKFAAGGFPVPGQLFVAREAGPELVGTMGGRTAVANNDQIVEGIREGVYDAVVAAMAQSGEGNRSESLNVYLDGKQINASVRKTQREKGAGIMTGGVVFA
jgi:hypothetical protein